MLIATCSTGSTGANTKTETDISKPHRDLHRASERQGDSRPLGSQPAAPTPLGPGPAGHATPAQNPRGGLAARPGSHRIRLRQEKKRGLDLGELAAIPHTLQPEAPAGLILNAIGVSL